MSLPTVHDPRSASETNLPPVREGGRSPVAMTPEERERWKWETRLRQLVMEETRTWKRLAWGAGIYFGLVLLIPLGFWIAGGAIIDHMVADRPQSARFVGSILQVIGVSVFWLLLIPLLLRFVRWVEAMWRRRRFSSTRGSS